MIEENKVAKASRLGLEVLTFLGDRKEYFSYKELCDEFNIKVRKADYKTFNKTINNLHKQSLLDLEKLDLSWRCQINDNGIRYLKAVPGHLRENILPCRTHNLVFSLDIVKRGQSSFKGFSIASQKMRNWKYPQLAKHYSPIITIQTTDSTALIRLKAVYGHDSTDAVFYAFDKVLELRSELMSEDSELVLGHPREIASTVQEHHALNIPKVAEWFEKYKVNWKDEKFVIDRSLGYPELECIQSGKAQEDFSELIDFFHSVVSKRFKWRELCS